jgi:hypothetical protein
MFLPRGAAKDEFEMRSVLSPKEGFWGLLMAMGFAPGTASDLSALQLSTADEE